MLYKYEEAEQLTFDFTKQICDGAPSRDSLILDNQKLVWRVIHNMRAKGQLVSYSLTFDQEDLFQIGMIGLIRAADSYKKDKGIEFSTYATYCVKNNILNEIRKNSIVDGKIYKSYDSYHAPVESASPLRSKEGVEESTELKRFDIKVLIDRMISENPKKKDMILDGANYLFEVGAGRKMPEIARMYSVDVTSVRNTVRQFRKMAQKIGA